MPAMPFSDLSARSRPADILAALGLVSGLLSAVWGQTYDLEALQPLAMVFLLDAGAAADRRSSTAWPWASAWRRGRASRGRRSSSSSRPSTPGARRSTRPSGCSATPTTTLYLVAASLCAGAVGAGLTHLGCALFCRRPAPPPWRIALTCAVGALAGLLFYHGRAQDLDERLLYLVWQPAVAFCIGLGLPRQSQDA